MKFINILTFTILLFALVNNITPKNIAFAKDTAIKLRKTETEAEKALDKILRIESGLEKSLKLKPNDMFTKEFIDDRSRQLKEYEERRKCKDAGDICDPWGCHPVLCCSDSPYRYAEDPYGSLFRETNCKNSSNNCYINMTTGIYYMKKENDTWHIDGISCCGHKINRKAQ